MEKRPGDDDVRLLFVSQQLGKWAITIPGSVLMTHSNAWEDLWAWPFLWLLLQLLLQGTGSLADVRSMSHILSSAREGV